jgi:hypothetical protein
MLHNLVEDLKKKLHNLGQKRNTYRILMGMPEGKRP